MTTLERFLTYVTTHTASSEETSRTPTTDCQFTLSRELERELNELGVSGVCVDEHAYVYGFLPATPGMENKPSIGLIAHIDTIPDFPGENVKPQIIENYDGGDVVLGSSGRVLSAAMFPHLPSLKGQTLITTDGTTVLGADDKAGVAAIMSALQTLIEERRPHGRVAVCFTPDEEVGHGAALLELERLGADFAYTVDGEELEEINFETFNAAGARFAISGVNIHPGSAKNMMVNASHVAMEIDAMLPATDRPEHTEGREGFFHLTEMHGAVDHATLDYIIRDHDAAVFAARKELLRRAEARINEIYGPGTADHASLSYIIRDHDAAVFAARKDLLRRVEARINETYGAGTVSLTIRDQYRNMAEVLCEHKEVVELAERAIRRVGLTPIRVPVRGGTDGAQLSFRGLPCPNIGTGGYACHGPYEHITLERLETAKEIVLGILDENCQ